MPLTTAAIKHISTNSNLRAKLMLVEGKSEYTIKRWVTDNDNPDKNSDNLTKPIYTAVIIKETGLKLTEILVK